MGTFILRAFLGCLLGIGTIAAFYFSGPLMPRSELIYILFDIVEWPATKAMELHRFFPGGWRDNYFTMLFLFCLYWIFFGEICVWSIVAVAAYRRKKFQKVEPGGFPVGEDSQK